MAMPNAYAQYNNSKILTASPAELTLMLYEGAIKFCNIAIVAIENNDFQKAHTNIMKVEHIIVIQRLDRIAHNILDSENVVSVTAEAPA